MNSDERRAAAEAIGDEAERQVAEVRANLDRNDPAERSDDAHPGAALRRRDGRGTPAARRRCPSTRTALPIRAAMTSSVRPQERRPEDHAERIAARAALLAAPTPSRLAHLAANPEREERRQDADNEEPSPRIRCQRRAAEDQRRHQRGE